jgi:hypothetical protein
LTLAGRIFPAATLFTSVRLRAREFNWKVKVPM